MNVNFYELDQAYMFCFNVVMSLVSFDDPTKFYSSEMQDKYKELFNDQEVTRKLTKSE